MKGSLLPCCQWAVWYAQQGNLRVTVASLSHTSNFRRPLSLQPAQPGGTEGWLLGRTSAERMSAPDTPRMIPTALPVTPKPWAGRQLRNSPAMATPSCSPHPSSVFEDFFPTLQLLQTQTMAGRCSGGPVGFPPHWPLHR